jgi:dTDP-4-dehydrorhamnose reductase
MRVLVVGASGFLGRHVLAEAKRRGHGAVGTRTAAGTSGAGGTGATAGDAALSTFDLRRDRIRPALPPGFLAAGELLTTIHCAAISQPERCAREPDSRAVNVDGSMRLVEDVAALGGRTLFLSTGFVFDGTRGGYREDDAPAPINEYGRQKRAMEEWLLARADAFVGRVDKLVGHRRDEKHLFREWQDRIDARASIVSLRGQVFSPTDVADVASALVTAAERGMTGLHHIAGTEHWAREDLANLFLEVTGQHAAVELRDPAALGMVEPRPLRTWLDGSRFAHALGQGFTSMRELARRWHADEGGHV